MPTAALNKSVWIICRTVLCASCILSNFEDHCTFETERNHAVGSWDFYCQNISISRLSVISNACMRIFSWCVALYSELGMMDRIVVNNSRVVDQVSAIGTESNNRFVYNSLVYNTHYR